MGIFFPESFREFFTSRKWNYQIWMKIEYIYWKGKIGETISQNNFSGKESLKNVHNFFYQADQKNLLPSLISRFQEKVAF